jgi:hypothetical protein
MSNIAMFTKSDLLIFWRMRKKKQYIKTSTDIDHIGPLKL